MSMEPDANSVAIMRTIDRLTPFQRSMVHEYGFVIVAHTINLGVTHAGALRAALKCWRQGRQEEWLATDYINANRWR